MHAKRPAEANNVSGGPSGPAWGARLGSDRDAERGVRRPAIVFTAARAFMSPNHRTAKRKFPRHSLRRAPLALASKLGPAPCGEAPALQARNTAAKSLSEFQPRLKSKQAFPERPKVNTVDGATAVTQTAHGSKIASVLEPLPQSAPFRAVDFGVGVSCSTAIVRAASGNCQTQVGRSRPLRGLSSS
jgi:hypothetical protein